jgi:PAS domain S-box-containing protein
MANLDGKITYTNPFLTRMFGARSAEEVIGQNVWDFYPDGYRELREQEIIPALQRGDAWQAAARAAGVL